MKKANDSNRYLQEASELTLGYPRKPLKYSYNKDKLGDVMLLNIKNPRFQEIIEIVESLPNEEQEHLVKIIQNRLKQKQKQELLDAVRESRKAFIKGEVNSGTVADLMADLEEQ